MIKVTAAILEKNGRILAARRKTGKHMAGFWEFPGGKIEKDETPRQCLQRELKEELGIDCSIGDYFDQSTHAYDDKTVQLLCYFVSQVAGEIVFRDHDKIVWLRPSELESVKWAPADIPLVLKLIEFKKTTP